MSYTNKLVHDTIRSIDASTFTGSYQAVGSPLTYSSTIFKMVNNSDVPVTVSFDGTNDHDILPEGSFFLYDATANSPHSNNIFLKAGTQVFVSGAVGSGNVYVVSLYIPDGPQPSLNV